MVFKGIKMVSNRLVYPTILMICVSVFVMHSLSFKVDSIRNFYDIPVWLGFLCFAFLDLFILHNILVRLWTCPFCFEINYDNIRNFKVIWLFNPYTK